MRRNFRPTLTRPEDFREFWHSTRLQLESLDPQIERRAIEPLAQEGIEGEVISFESLGHVRVSAYFLRWCEPDPRPLIIYSHGYGCQCAPRWDWAQRGANVLGVDIRGFGLSAGALPRPSRWGYVLTGIETPETSVLRQAVCDYMQAARAGTMVCGDTLARTVFHGVSFAGGLALMSAAVLGSPDLLAVGVPTFGWAEGRNLFVRSGSGAEISNYLAKRPDYVEDTMLVMRYFDAINFAEYIRCPTLIGVGLEDEVVPAKTVYGIANHVSGPHELMEFPFSHTDRPEEQLWGRFETCWLEMALHGVPAGFGNADTGNSRA